MGDTILRVDRLGHRYSVDWAVRDVSFEVSEHTICALLGSNGAGKSTVMNVICGVLKQTEGEVLISGINTREKPMASKMHVGFLPQTPPLYNEFTVEEYLVHAAEMRRVPDRQVRFSVEEVLERCEIMHFRKRLLGSLSGGYRQRVGIAQAIIHKPKLVVFDEPTNGLDPTQILGIRQLIRSIAEESTVLISTHILQEVQAVCDEIVMMERGQVIFRGSVGDFDNYIVPDTLYLRIENNLSPEVFRSIHGVSAVEPLHDGAFRVRFTDLVEVSEQLVDACAVNGWHLAEMRLERSSMDTVFSELSKKHH